MTSHRTIPESEYAVAAQMRWLLEGKRMAVLLPPGTPLPELPAGLVSAFPTALGLFIYPPHQITPAEIVDHIKNDTVGELLGYGIGAKPEHPTDCVIIRGPNGREKQAVVTDAAHAPDVEAAAFRMSDPGDTITREQATDILRERCDELAKHEVTIHPFKSEDAAAIESLAIAHPDGRSPYHPTWVIRRHGELVGAVGINSLPLFHLWLPVPNVTARQCHDVLKQIENTYRLANVPMVATLLDIDCSSYPFKERHGYIELSDERLCVKQL